MLLVNFLFELSKGMNRKIRTSLCLRTLPNRKRGHGLTGSRELFCFCFVFNFVLFVCEVTAVDLGTAEHFVAMGRGRGRGFFLQTKQKRRCGGGGGGGRKRWFFFSRPLTQRYQGCWLPLPLVGARSVLL